MMFTLSNQFIYITTILIVLFIVAMSLTWIEENKDYSSIIFSEYVNSESFDNVKSENNCVAYRWNWNEQYSSDVLDFAIEDLTTQLHSMRSSELPRQVNLKVFHLLNIGNSFMLRFVYTFGSEIYNLKNIHSGKNIDVLLLNVIIDFIAYHGILIPPFDNLDYIFYTIFKNQNVIEIMLLRKFINCKYRWIGIDSNSHSYVNSDELQLLDRRMKNLWKIRRKLIEKSKANSCSIKFVYEMASKFCSGKKFHLGNSEVDFIVNYRMIDDESYNNYYTNEVIVCSAMRVLLMKFLTDKINENFTMKKLLNGLREESLKGKIELIANEQF